MKNSKKIKTAMIFAAGLGTRMLPLTLQTPKPMVKILNKPLLEYKIEYFKKYGIEKIIINCHHLAEQIEDYINSKYSNDNIIVIKEETLLDTGGGLVNARGFLGNKPFFVTNSDTIHIDKNISALEMLENKWNHLNPNNNPDMLPDMLMLLIDKSKAVGYKGDGDFNIIENNKLQWKQTQHKYVYTGLMIINPKILINYTEYYTYNNIFSLRKIWIDNTNYNNGIIKNIMGIPFDGSWLHIDSVEGKKNAESILKI